MELSTMNAAADFTDYVLAKAQGLPRDAFPARFAKATIGASTTATMSALQQESRAFVELVQRETLLGRMVGTLSAPPFANVVDIVTDPDVTWRGEGLPAPVASMGTAAVQTDASSFGVIIGVENGLIRQADSRARTMIERRMIRANRRAEDREVLSDDAAVSTIRPAGLLYGVTAIAGGSPASLTSDLEELWTAVSDGAADKPYFIVSPRGGMYLYSLNEDGTPRFPNVGPLGGTIAGVPVLTSRAAGNRLILIDAARLAVSDSGLTVDISENAAVQMDDSPSSPAQLVSGFQSNTTFLKFTRYISWALTTDEAIAFLELPINGSPA